MKFEEPWLPELKMGAIFDQSEAAMLKSELEQIIANGENSGVEFKRDDCRPEQLAREIVAMVNLNGRPLEKSWR
ncbi:MAG: hypothetical protein M0T73_13605 [Deltaproteobacteria bacterium]|nr:hypothetical protein [Deltaproteobacteria bacterium]